MNIIHLILTIVTGGLWLPVWVVCLLVGANKQSKQTNRNMEKMLAEMQAHNQIMEMK